MIGAIAAFEFRYQARSPLFLAAAAVFFLATFFDMAVMKLVNEAGGTLLFNSPHAIIKAHVLASLLFLFVGAAFISNVIVRDDQTGFGPLIRATGVSKADYLYGRFIGAFAAGVLVIVAATLGTWLGTLMPFANQEMMGPNRLSAFVYALGLFALPNALIISAILFALATVTRSTAGTFVGVILLLIFYLVSQRLMENQPGMAGLRALADPLGGFAYMASSRYLTTAELNAGVVAVSDMLLWSRLLWVGLALGLLALTFVQFRFADRGASRRRLRKLRRHELSDAKHDANASLGRLPDPSFGTASAIVQFLARAGLEARFIFRSPLFLILLLIAFAFTLPGLLTVSTIAGTPLYPLTSVFVPTIDASFGTMLIVVAAFYGGELVWRERERRINEIVDATPLPAWALMLPKMFGLALVLLAILAISVAVALLVQWLSGGAPLGLEDYLLWYLLPGGVDAILIAVLSVFVAALSPGKYAGWGIMAAYIVLLIFGPTLGLEYSLLVYGQVPDVPLSDMVGTGVFGAAAWWTRAFWASVAMLLLVAVQLLWPRGTDTQLMRRLRRLPSRMRGTNAILAVVALTLCVLSGAWIIYNTIVLNPYRGAGATQRYLAGYEKRFLRYARLPEPTVKHVELAIALYPEDIRAEVRGRYRLVNETDQSIDRLHVRLANQKLELLSLNFPAAKLEQDFPDFGYRIYRLDRPMQPGEIRSLAFRTRREQRGFRFSGVEDELLPNGTVLDALDLTPQIGMNEAGLIDDPVTRRELGLPRRRPLPRLDDVEVANTPDAINAWTTADITVSTAADQVPVAPGKKVAERVADGRRIARFLSNTPIQGNFSVHSGRFAVARQHSAGVDHEIYYHPSHHWNVERMLKAMEASIAYYRRAFGPYQFDQARIVEAPYGQGGHAYANTISIGEGASFGIDLRDPQKLDMASVFVAHELSHQWWGHQVRGARMQGITLLVESLAQYSALMVMEKLEGEAKIRPYLAFQRDRYLSFRRTQTAPEEPLVSVEISQGDIAYGKGALAFYLLRQRMGEDAVNRALRRLVDRYRFSTPPYPRSVDLIRMLRAEARTPEQQALITDLFERITLYDLRVDQPRAVKRADGRWDVTVPVVAQKFHADPHGRERTAPLAEPIEVGLFSQEPGSGGFDRNAVIRMEALPIRSGRQVLRFVADRQPTHAGVDPFNLYIDRNAHDNLAAVAN